MKQTQQQNKLWFWLSLLGLALFFILLRWNSLNIPLIRDEGEYAYSAWLLSQNILPYANAFMQKPPMIIYTYLLGYLINPQAYWIFRLLAYLSIAGSTALLGLIARKEFGKGAGWVAVWLFTPLVFLPGLEQFTANTEKFMLLPLLGVLAVYLWRKGEAGRWHWFFAGSSSALALLYKPTIFPVILFIFLVWVIEAWQAKARLIKNVPAFIVGGLAASFLVLSYFIFKDGAASLWECVVVFNRYYSQFGLGGFLSYGAKFFFNWWILFILLAWFIYQRPPRWWFYLGLLLLAYLSTYGSFYGHYYIVTLPFWALIGSAAITLLAGRIATKKPIKLEFIRIALTAIVLLIICWPDFKWLLMSPQEFEQHKYTGGLPFPESRLVAKRVAELSVPDDYVYVAGSEPQILYYAKRKSPSRFVIAYPMMMPTPLAEKYQAEARDELAERLPKVIVLARSNSSWLISNKSPKVFMPYLDQLLVDKYALVGGYIKYNEAGYWQEPIDEAAVSFASLLVFKRK